MTAALGLGHSRAGVTQRAKAEARNAAGGADCVCCGAGDKPCCLLGMLLSVGIDKFMESWFFYGFFAFFTSQLRSQTCG